MIHSLGVNMGGPFWGDHFEAADLSAELRAWWNEPQFVESVPKATRVAYLKAWIAKQNGLTATAGATTTEPMAIATGDALNEFPSSKRSAGDRTACEFLSSEIPTVEPRMLLPVASAIGSRGVSLEDSQAINEPTGTLNVSGFLDRYVASKRRDVWIPRRLRDGCFILDDSALLGGKPVGLSAWAATAS